MSISRIFIFFAVINIAAHAAIFTHAIDWRIRFTPIFSFHWLIIIAIDI